MRYFAALLVAGLTLPLQGQASVSGVVTDSARRPIADAEVLVLSLPRSARTDSLGRFSIDNVPSGTYTVRARRLGYFPADASVTLTAGASKALLFELYERPQVLAPVDVKATCVRWEIEGFACRAAKGTRGIFMDEEAIDAKHALEIGELFRDVPGMRAGRTSWSSTVGWKCMTTIVNGKKIDSTNPPPNWPSDLIGIEIYLNPDSVPGEYSHFVWKNVGRQKTPTRCSVLNMWTSGRPRYTPGTRKK